MANSRTLDDPATLAMICNGFSNQQFARELEIAPTPTVKAPSPSA